MITRALLATIFVGLITGLLMTAVQQWRVVPLIVAAEAFEAGQPVPAQSSGIKSNLSLVASAHAHESHSAVGPFDLSRLGGSIVANLVTFSGFSLLLFGISTLLGKPINMASSLVWAACGWLAVHFLPAIGLPPELPGFPAADLQARQIWWVATVVLSAFGLGLLALSEAALYKIAGLALVALPHVFGAPQPADITTTVPALYAAEYSVAALAASLISWVVMALGLGIAHDRFFKDEA